MPSVMDERTEKRLELERKKQKLAEMREARKRADEERKKQLLASIATENGVTRQTTNVEELLAEVGIPTGPPIETSPEKANGALENNASFIS
uniref:Cytoplasmic dynein 1 intermediate chain 2 n=1 Tax=Heterorhabditis bacteriophora TaxID=37862 RepID=A0A1I7XUD7_HETBA